MRVHFALPKDYHLDQEGARDAWRSRGDWRSLRGDVVIIGLPNAEQRSLHTALSHTARASNSIARYSNVTARLSSAAQGKSMPPKSLRIHGHGVVTAACSVACGIPTPPSPPLRPPHFPLRCLLHCLTRVHVLYAQSSACLPLRLCCSFCFSCVSGCPFPSGLPLTPDRCRPQNPRGEHITLAHAPSLPIISLSYPWDGLLLVFARRFFRWLQIQKIESFSYCSEDPSVDFRSRQGVLKSLPRFAPMASSPRCDFASILTLRRFDSVKAYII